MATTTATPAEADEWVSRTDAAKLARCSEDMIKRDEKKQALETRRGTRGRAMLRLADLVTIGWVRAEDLSHRRVRGGGRGAAPHPGRPPRR